MKLSQTKANPYSKTVVFGAAKTGKTRLVGRLAEHYKLDYVDGESGISTMLSPSNLRTELQDNITLFRLPDDGDNGVMFTSLYKMLTSTVALSICDTHGRPDCAECRKLALSSTSFSMLNRPADSILVIDSLTQLTTSCLSYITRGKPDEYKLEFSDFGKLKGYMERMFSIIQVTPCNIVAITHEEVAEFEDGKKRIVPVAGSSKFAVTLAKYFDSVVYTEQRGALFICSSGPGKVANVLTGSRLNVRVEDMSKLYTPLQAIYTLGIDEASLVPASATK